MSTPNEKFADQRFKYPSPGIGAVGQYQTSGIPFLSSSFIVPDIIDSPTTLVLWALQAQVLHRKMGITILS